MKYTIIVVPADGYFVKRGKLVRGNGESFKASRLLKVYPSKAEAKKAVSRAKNNYPADFGFAILEVELVEAGRQGCSI